MVRIKALDLFCGAGGASLGLREAGVEVVGAVDYDEAACKTYEENLGLKPWKVDMLEEDVKYGDILNHFDLEEDDIGILAGCPPCQNFSSLRDTRPWPEDESKDALLAKFIDMVDEGRPPVVFFENVPGIATTDGGRYLRHFEKKMGECGYGRDIKIVNAADYGVPQLRKRVIGLCVRGESDENVSLPEGTHLQEGTGRRKWATVRDAIEGLPDPNQDKDDWPREFRYLKNHVAKNHRPETVEMIRHVPKDGGSRRDLPREYWLDCHKNLDGGGAGNVYGRMAWDEPANTMTTRCTTPSCGRFLHPEQDRAITAREAARIQKFPDYFVFPEIRKDAERLIGNAVPPLLVQSLATGFIEEHAVVE